MHTKQQLHTGISLLEVLAALFVVSIGLLGVLAVIPFGAYQVSQAQHAEHASNMLANAVEEMIIREMVPKVPSTSKFVWFEPHDHTIVPSHMTYDIQKIWQDIMRGQDDLVYTTYGDKRPDFAGQNNKIQSSGKYTWFFTYLPPENTDKVDVDVLACYNRVPNSDVQVKCSFSPSNRGGTLTGFDAKDVERLTETKYVFVSWGQENGAVEGGAWCRIVFLDKASSNPKAIVVGNLQTADKNVHVYIPSGVMYCKQVKNVTMK
ncbi:MAG: hypothetical protein LBI05_11800 [Planctomycetaceae bacterium]|jgi:type II secretory pathway pseudopilin PulG|nr:hypothetical protein [Planctomycetaceae bacterium]